MPRIGWAPVDGRGAFYFAHGYAIESPATTALVGGDRRGRRVGGVPRRPVPSGEERRRGARFLEAAWSDASPAPDPVPRRGRRARREGRKFQGLRDVGDPVELGAAYSDAGADELVFLDVKATLEERGMLLELVGRVADRLAIPFTVGGGVRTAADGEALLRAGADKVGVNSAALARPAL